MIADNAVSMAKLSSGALPTDIVVNQDNLASNSVRESEIQDGEVKTAKIGDNQITTIKIGDDQITLAKLADAVANSLVPVGSVLWYAADAIPTGYLECAGATVSRSTYAALFAVIGTVYGAGDGSSTFKLPDLRGEFVRGYDHGRGIDAGRGIGTPQSDEFKNHQHQFGSDDQVRSQGSYTSLGSFGYDASSDTGGGGQRARTKDDSTNFGGTETRPRNIALLACIKY
jgi:microcystin-dependent protein